MNNQELDPSVEAAHLRRLLDVQPGCLMRLGADGTVLAANDAALTLLDLASRAEALGRDFTAWVPPEQHDRWKAFASAIVQGVPASIECDITTASGERRPALFHAMPLADHPDGVISMLVAVRAVSGQRQLEAAIVELEEQLRQCDADRRTARESLAEAEAKRCELIDTVADLEAKVREGEAAGSQAEEQMRRLRAELQARDEALTAAKANLEARDEALAAAKANLEARDEALAVADAIRQAADAKCAHALGEVRQFEMALEAFDSRRQGEVEEARAGRLRLETALEEAKQAIVLLEQREQQALQQREALQARLDEAEAASRQRETQREALQARLDEAEAASRQRETQREALQARLDEAEAASRQRETQREAVQARLDEAEAACHHREMELHQLQAAHAELAAAHAAATDEHDRLATALETLVRGLPRAAVGPGAAAALGVRPTARKDGQDG